MADAFVLNNNGDGQHVACGNFKRLATERRDDLRTVALDSEDVHIEDSVAQKGKCLLHLRIVAVILCQDSVSAEPTMRRQFAVLGSIVRQLNLFRLHVASLALRNLVFDVERKG